MEIRTTSLMQLYRSNDSESILLVMTEALGKLKKKKKHTWEKEKKGVLEVKSYSDFEEISLFSLV